MTSPGPAPTQRFSDRVADYVRFRPGYPPDVWEVLAQETGLSDLSVVADVGCGTGISSTLFLDHGCRLLGIEPNAAMRAAACERHASNPRFQAIAGTAEASGLPDHSVDFVVAAQAMHWFDREACRAEFARILRRGGWVVLLWNTRRTTPGFMAEYESLLLRYGTDYSQVDHRSIDENKLAAFFRPGGFATRRFDNRQELDLAGLYGRVMSCSYIPQSGSPPHEEMTADLQKLFDRYQVAGKVRLEYDCELHWGRLFEAG